MKTIQKLFTISLLVFFAGPLIAGYRLTLKNDHQSGSPIFIWGIPTSAPAYLMARIPSGSSADLEWPTALKTIVAFTEGSDAQKMFEKYITEHPGAKDARWVNSFVDASRYWNDFERLLPETFTEGHWLRAEVPTGSKISIQKRAPFSGQSKIDFLVTSRGIPSYQEAAKKEEIAQLAEIALREGRPLDPGYFVDTPRSMTKPYDKKAAEIDAKAKRDAAETAKRIYYSERKKLFGY